MILLRPMQLLRLITINRVLIRHGLDEIIFAIHLLRPIRFLFYLAPWNWFRRVRASRGERIRRSLEDLGPIFIKFGQMLSTRRDLLPDDIAKELARLQDRVPPFPDAQAFAIIERALGKPISEVFLAFDKTPLASASIAQVYAAVLHSGEPVVVKVVRPDILPVIRRDLQLMYIMAQLAERYWSEGPRLRPVEVVAEYEKTILDELDLMREAANATQIKRNFSGSSILYIPTIYWDYTRRQVMVMERIHGVPVADMQVLSAVGADLKLLSERGVEIFFTQVFRHNFFHADMHPGNIFIDIDIPEDPTYIAVDFGIVGTLTGADRRYLAENFHAFFNRDYRRVAELHVESGWVPADTRTEQLESAIRSVCEPIFQRPLKDISFGQLLLRLFQTARRYDMQVQPQLVLLQKTLLNIEGLGRDLYPDLDLWKTAKPFIERWIDEQVGLRAMIRGAKYGLPVFLEKLPQMPGLMHEIMLHEAKGRTRRDISAPQLEALRQEIIRAQQRSSLTVLAATLFICATLLLLFAESLPGYLGVPYAALGMAALAGVLLLMALWHRG